MTSQQPKKKANKNQPSNTTEKKQPKILKQILTKINPQTISQQNIILTHIAGTREKSIT